VCQTRVSKNTRTCFSFTVSLNEITKTKQTKQNKTKQKNSRRFFIESVVAANLIVNLAFHTEFSRAFRHLHVLTRVLIGAVVSLFLLRFVIGRSDFFGDFFGFDCAQVLSVDSSQFFITGKGHANVLLIILNKFSKGNDPLFSLDTYCFITIPYYSLNYNCFSIGM